jgi:hypothetical protein
MMETRTFKYSTAFTRLAEVAVVHAYYRSGRSSDLVFQPSQETQELLRQYAILFRAGNSGFTLLMDENRDLSSPVFGGALRLRIDFRSLNPIFLNFTDLPYVNDQYLEFSSASNNGYILHPDAVVGENSRMERPSDGLSGCVELYFNQENELFGQGELPRLPSLGRSYTIRFGARKTCWRYHFYGEEHLVDQYLDFYIQNKSRESVVMEFGVPEKQPLKNGAPGFTITLEAPTELMDKPTQVLTLNKAAGHNGQRYVKTLPNANPQHLNYNEKLNIFYTEIFVKL